ncbi:related to BRN1-protein required for chromosome condensation [Sporisorium reilianum SRZ2]|uniref:Condensin complex subunit 2 n=1 Tax=Sporisorium reilianum (strain SRZ2) TaxID=999809 RepID=E6ZMZ9_SPORE|nr:related to BRN1-protein required for chromosome condensation [Sporisorium reilianum SRZ2]
MPSRHSSSSSSRAPLEESRAANRSISASFAGTKPSLSSKSSSSRKSSSGHSSSSSSSKSRSASGKHRGRFDDDDDIAEEEEDDQDDGDDYDEEDENNHRHSNARKASGATSKSMSRPPSAPSSRQPSASNNANRSILARSNPNASIMMGGAAAANTSVAFQNSRVAALARSHAVVDASSIMRPRGQAGHPAANGAAASANGDPKGGAAPASASLRVDTSSFEEWMKMATDNKINSTNTWSFALIDYFHDMSLLRNDSGDGSINFQKASCTLDGCVKVWTSRVDSVVVETGKLLSGLQDDIDQATRKDRRGNENGDEDADDDDGDDDGNGNSTRKRKRNKEATLAKTFDHIQIKKFELEFTVDPLFKKTSADFDEGGASGLLMNHLGVDSSMAVIFDASDVAGVGSDEDMAKMLSVGEDGDAGEDAPSPAAAAAAEDDDQDEMVDLSKLASKWLDSDEFGHADGASDDVASLLSRRVLCPTLCNFRFSKDDDTPFGVGLDEFNQQTFHTATHADAYYDSQHVPGMRAQSEEFLGGGFHDDANPLMDGAEGEGDFFDNDVGGPMDDNEDDGNDFFGALDNAPAFHHGGPVVLDGTTGGVDSYGPFDPSAGPSSELVMAMAFNPSTGMPVDGADGENGSDLFDYFDRRLMRNWAGPEHWKLSRVAATGPMALGASTGAAAQAAAAAAAARKESKKSKEPFVIDFLSEEGAVNLKEIFEQPKQSSSITLPASARNKMASLAASSSDAYLLPEDRHFSSKQLLRLFLKPRVAINMRHKGQQAAGGGFGGDAQLWAEVAGDADEADGADGGMPFDTQFFHDADDGYDANAGGLGGLDDSPANVTAGGDAEDEELTQTLQALNRVKPEYVNYAKKAKRVDVKKLKENIWKELGILASTEDAATLAAKAQAAAAAGDEDGDVSMASTLAEAEASGSVKTFESVLSGLQKAYTQDKMEEISTSFCFICLLHLANEEGLAISTGSEDKIEALRAKRGRNSTTPTKADAAGGLFGRLAAGRVMRTSSEDDDLGGEGDEEPVEGEEGYEEDELRVGKLSALRIMKDPRAYRSA